MAFLSVIGDPLVPLSLVILHTLHVAYSGCRFTTPPFTFLIGAEQKPFYVHADLFKNVSQPLHTLVNGSMRESTERKAVLEDVEVDTFQHLLEYCYTGIYGALVERKVQQGVKDVNVAKQGAKGDLVFCHECVLDITYQSNCVFGEYEYSCDECGQHIELWRGREGSPPAPKKTVAQKDIIPIEMTIAQLNDYLANLQLDAKASLMQHARLYMLADRYLMTSQKDLCVVRLLRELRLYYDNNKTDRAAKAADVADLLEYVYAVTTEDGRGDNRHELRKVVIADINKWAEELLLLLEFQALLQEGGPLALDFAIRLAGFTGCKGFRQL